MNNEEKILSILEDLQRGQAVTNDRLDKLEAGQAEIRGEMTEIRGEMTEIRGEMTEIREDMTKLMDAGFKMEQELYPKVGILLDVTQGHTDKLNEHSAMLAQIDDKIDRIDTVQIVHTHQIERLAQ